MAGSVPEESGRETCFLKQVNRQRGVTCAGVSVCMVEIVCGELAVRNVMKIL